MDRRFKIIKGYDREIQNPIVIMKGSTILIIKRNYGKYKDWFWCRTDDGKDAFVRVEILEVGSSTATFLKDYESKELTVFESDVLVPIFEMGGWTWARKSSEDEGWIPMKLRSPTT